MGLLMMGFEQVSDGFTAVGGFTSRGLGRADFVWSSITTVSAADLLGGKPATALAGDAMTAEIRTWQDALATRYNTAATGGA